MRSPARALCLALLLAGCGPSEAEKRAAAEAARVAAADRELHAYRELLRLGNRELAASIGAELVRKYPGTSAAREVEASLAEVAASANAAVDARRLAALWTYQSGSQSGGEQHAASIYSSEPSGEGQIRLILRRHAEWGESAYLHGGTRGFRCASPCTVRVSFDGAPAQALAAEIPSGGEPAVFIEDPAFLERLPRVREVVFDVERADGEPQRVRFEVGGFEPSRWARLSGQP